VLRLVVARVLLVHLVGGIRSVVVLSVT
jgi:hypothetical protein